MIPAAVFCILLVAAAAGCLAHYWYAHKWAEFEGGAHIAVDSDSTANVMRWLQLLGNPPEDTVPCMAAQPSSLPLICGRNNGHAGHHIAFGAGHRILATWARTVGERDRLREIPLQRRGGEWS